MDIRLVRYPTEQDWLWVKRCALVTVGKDSDVPPTLEWKKRILNARHSPIRELVFSFEIRGVPYWVAMHLVRHHVGCQPYIKTQRTDRTGELRDSKSQDSPVDMIWTLNAESLITVAEKRLCWQAATETRELVQWICDIVIAMFPEFREQLVPQCVRLRHCPEMNPCKKKPYPGAKE